MSEFFFFFWDITKALVEFNTRQAEQGGGS